jgi:galactokinase
VSIDTVAVDTVHNIDRRALMAQTFAEQFGRAPTAWVRAPGRVDLMGSHTDYNLGYVMTMTVDRDIWIALAPRDDGHVRVASLNLVGESTFALGDTSRDAAHPWTNYVRGVAVELVQAGHPLRGFDGLIHSTVPLGSGLSSSAALEMAAATAFQVMGGFNLDPVEMARLGQRAENHFVGVNCGILDQFSSAMGQEGAAVLLDCRTVLGGSVPIAPGIAVVICDTKSERHLKGTEYSERRAQCEEGVARLQAWLPEIEALRDVTLEEFESLESSLPSVVARRCRFIIEENARVLALAEALPTGDRAQLAALFASSWVGARDLYEILAPAMEAMHAAAQASPGLIGIRQAGGGFGGCLVALVEEAQAPAFATATAAAYEVATDITPALFSVVATAGAGLLAERA